MEVWMLQMPDTTEREDIVVLYETKEAAMREATSIAEELDLYTEDTSGDAVYFESDETMYEWITVQKKRVY